MPANMSISEFKSLQVRTLILLSILSYVFQMYIFIYMYMHICLYVYDITFMY